MTKKEQFINIVKNLLNSRKKLVGLVVLLSILGFVGWRIFASKEEKTQFQTTQVERGTIVSSVTASGQILTANVINITTQAQGLVKQVFVSEGDKVVAGQKIAEIELDLQGTQGNASAWSSYLSAKNGLESAKATQYALQSELFTKWDKFKKLAESSTYQNPDGSPNYVNRGLPEFHIAEDDWLAAEAKYKNQQAVVNQAQAALNSSWLSYQVTSPIITAPIAGNITSITIVAGITISSQEESVTSNRVATIRNENNPLASFNLSEIDVAKTKIGQKATITLDSISGKTFTGKVVSVDKVGQVTNGVTNYPAVIRLDTQAEDLLPNMAASADIIIDSKDNVLVVPSQAVQTLGGQSIVRVLRGGQAQEIPVEAGLSSETQIEIISGLSEGETIVVSEQTSGEQTTTFDGGGGMRGIMPGGFGGR